MFWNALTASVAAITFAVISDTIAGQKFMVYEDWRAYLWMTIGGVCDFTGMTLHTVAFMNDKSSFVSIFTFTAVVYAFLGDTFIFNFEFRMVQIFCGLIILGSTIFVGVYKYRQDLALKQKEENQEELFKEI